MMLNNNDIAAIKEMNESLLSQNKQLQKTQLALEKKISQLKEFAGIITHDVRGPAHNINKMLEMFETSTDPEIKAATFDYLKKVSNDLSKNLHELIQILQIHLEKDIPVSECSFKEVIDSVLLQLNETIQLKDAVINIELKATTIIYPRIFLQSIIYNLLSNSLKYTQPNLAPVIEITTFYDGENSKLSVKDNGLGIDLNKFGHLLFKFQKSFHSGFESKGIGLYLIKNQIEDRGGDISVMSDLMNGTTFTVRF